jgi:hypothetical protein
MYPGGVLLGAAFIVLSPVVDLFSPLYFRLVDEFFRQPKASDTRTKATRFAATCAELGIGICLLLDNL